MLTKVAKGGGGSTGRGVAVVNTSHGQQLLGYGGTHNAGTTGSRDQPHHHATTLASDLQTDMIPSKGWVKTAANQ